MTPLTSARELRVHYRPTGNRKLAVRSAGRSLQMGRFAVGLLQDHTWSYGKSPQNQTLCNLRDVASQHALHSTPHTYPRSPP